MIPFAMWTPSIWELAIILVIVLVLFGAGKLPQVFGQLGSALKAFKEAQKEADPVDADTRKRISPPDAIEEAEEVKEEVEARRKQ